MAILRVISKEQRSLLQSIDKAREMNVSTMLNADSLPPKAIEETLRMNNKLLTQVSKWLADN